MPARALLLAVSPLAFAIALDAQAPSQAAPRTGLIVGQIVDGDSGKPVGGAIVSISGTSPAAGGRDGATPLPISRVIATADGRFAFSNLPRGTFGISATRPGYTDGAHGRKRVNGPSKPVTLGDGERVGDIAIRVWKHAAISGMVVDEAGEPLVNIAVRALRRGVGLGARYFAMSSMAATDDRGVYRFGNLQPGEYLVAIAARHVSLPLSLTAILQSPQSGLPDRPVIIPELSSILVSRPGAPGTMQVGDMAYAIGAGSAIPPPPAGDRMFVYPTTFYPAGHGPAQASVIALASGEERNAIDFQLRPVPAVRVSGSVSQPDVGVTKVATPLRLVSADAQEVTQEADAISTIPDHGNFTFPAVPAGNYSLRAGSRTRTTVRAGEADNFLWADVPVSVGQHDVSGVNVVLQPGFRIRGRFEFDGSSERPAPERIQQVPVTIEPASPGAVGFTPPPGRPEFTGHFTSVGLVPGKYFVRVGASPAGWRFKTATHEGRDVADLPLDLRGDAEVVITFSDRWTSVRGRVTSRQGEPDLDAIVLLFPTDVQQWTHYGTNVRRLKSAMVTGTGEYALTSVPEGDYYLVAIPDADAAGWQDVKFLESLTRVATRITVGDGEAKTQDLRTQDVR